MLPEHLLPELPERFHILGSFVLFHNLYKWDVLFLGTKNANVDRYWTFLCPGENSEHPAIYMWHVVHQQAQSDHSGNWSCSAAVSSTIFLSCLPEFSPLQLVLGTSLLLLNLVPDTFLSPWLEERHLSLFRTHLHICSEGKRTKPYFMWKHLKC